MSKKLICTGLVLFIFLAAFSVSSDNCPSFADSEEKFLNILRLALQDRLETGGEDEDYSKEIKDLMQFYVTTKDWDEADCSVKGKQTGKTIKEILEIVYEKISDVKILKCEDGTEYGKCASGKPSYCFSGNIVDKCSVCGCPGSLICHNEKCKTAEEVEQCEDGTKNGECSVEKPKFCDKGDLVYDCEKCGCYEDEYCDKGTKLCYVKEAEPCKVPTEGMLIEENTVLCEGDYNISQGLIIRGEGITLDCNGASLTGDKNGYGLTISNSYITVKNCKITNYVYGLLMNDASNSAVEGNELRGNVFGVYVNSSTNNDFKGNMLMYNLNYSFYLTDSSNNIILDNDIYGSDIFDKKEAVNIYCREGIQNDYYANAKGPKCELLNCGNGICDKGENCFNCADCACGKDEMCINWACKETEKKLSKFQLEACKSADKAGTCDRLERLGLVTAEQCCDRLGKCC